MQKQFLNQLFEFLGSHGLIGVFRAIPKDKRPHRSHKLKAVNNKIAAPFSADRIILIASQPVIV